MPGVSCEDYYFTNSWKCTNLIDIIVFNDIVETCVQVIQEIHDLKLKKHTFCWIVHTSMRSRIGRIILQVSFIETKGTLAIIHPKYYTFLCQTVNLNSTLSCGLGSLDVNKLDRRLSQKPCGSWDNDFSENFPVYKIINWIQVSSTP